jgi:hypothetical protein
LSETFSLSPTLIAHLSSDFFYHSTQIALDLDSTMAAAPSPADFSAKNSAA